MDITVLCDSRSAEKEVEKCAKYQLLAGEIDRLWPVETKIVSVLVETLGTVSKPSPGCFDTIGLTSYCHMYVSE